MVVNYPMMPVLVIDALCGPGEMRIGKGADRYGDMVRLARRLPEDCAAAARAKVERHFMPAVRRPCMA